MVYNPNANWTAETAKLDKRPVYFINIDGLTTKEYATREVRSPAIAKKLFMKIPSGSSQRVDRIQGKSTVGVINIELIDSGGDITDLISTEATAGGGTPTLASLVNRKIKIFGGYTDLVEADYPLIFTGRVSGLKMSQGGTSFIFEISDLKRKLQEPIMLNATTDVPTVIEGNIVNILYSILANDFQTSGSFPLDSKSGTPTGLGIAAADLNTVDMISQRDTWLSSFNLRFTFTRQENSARRFIEQELMRLVGYQVVFADGRLSLRASNPPLILSISPPKITESDIIGPPQWSQRFDLHFNRFRILGDHNAVRASGELDAAAASGQNLIPLDKTAGFKVDGVYTLSSQDFTTQELIQVATVTDGVSVSTAANLVNSYVAKDVLLSESFPKALADVDDTADQTSTGEIIQFELKSKGLRTVLNGVDLASAIVTRLKRRYVKPPVSVVIRTHFTKRIIEVGDVVLLSHSKIPNVLTGTRGITDQPFEVIRTDVDFQAGQVVLELLDTVPGGKFFIIAPDATPTYLSASAEEKASFGFWADRADDEMSNGDPGYRII